MIDKVATADNYAIDDFLMFFQLVSGNSIFLVKFLGLNIFYQMLSIRSFDLRSNCKILIEFEGSNPQKSLVSESV